MRRHRREPRPGGGPQGGGVRRPRPHLALRRAAADQQGAIGGALRRRRALGRPRPPGRRPRPGARRRPAARCAVWSRSPWRRTGRRGRRGGASAADVAALAERVVGRPVAAAGGRDGASLRSVATRTQAFASLAGSPTTVRIRHPGATWVSAGMCGDLEAAIDARRDTRACRHGNPRSQPPAG